MHQHRDYFIQSRPTVPQKSGALRGVLFAVPICLFLWTIIGAIGLRLA